MEISWNASTHKTRNFRLMSPSDNTTLVVVFHPVCGPYETPNGKKMFFPDPVHSMIPLKSVNISYASHIISRNGDISWKRKILDQDDIETLLWMVGD